MMEGVDSRNLTHQERRMCVLMFVASGFSSKEMAQVLGVVKTTIDNDVAWWQARLHAQNRSQLSALSVFFGLLDEKDFWFDGSREWLAAFLERRLADPDDRLVLAARSGNRRIR